MADVTGATLRIGLKTTISGRNKQCWILEAPSPGFLASSARPSILPSKGRGLVSLFVRSSRDGRTTLRSLRLDSPGLLKRRFRRGDAETARKKCLYRMIDPELQLETRRSHLIRSGNNSILAQQICSFPVAGGKIPSSEEGVRHEDEQTDCG